MQEYKEKSLNRYVIASFDVPTQYLRALGNARYCFIDNVVNCTKMASKSIADELCAECSRNFDMDLVVVKLRIDYTLVDDTEDCDEGLS